MTDNNQPETKIMSRQEQLVMRLRRYNEWRRGGEFEQPEPAEIGRDIDDAIALIERYESLESTSETVCSTALIIEAGDYELVDDDPDVIWIYHQTGEGAAIPRDEFADYIDALFKQRF